MSKITTLTSAKAGLPPGSLVHIGDKKTEETTVSIIDYDGEQFKQMKCKKPEDTFEFRDKASETWINITGLHDINIIETIGKHFGLHSLTLEDILNTNHRPKTEFMDQYVIISIKSISISSNKLSLSSEQVSFVLGNGWIISFMESQSGIFNSIIKNLGEKKGTLRKRSCDYLLYRLIDTIVDNYFVVTEYFSEINDDLEEQVLQNPNTKVLQKIQHRKRQLGIFRRAVTPLREIIYLLLKDENKLIDTEIYRYFHDVQEHIVQVHEVIDSQRDMMMGVMDLYQSGISGKMNQVMQTLTIIATIFIPLTFVVGVYGMNFYNMSELKWRYGYLGVWIIMIVIVLSMLYYFKRKRWM